MLVLTRKLNQQIRLGNEITVTVLRVKGNTIRLGIDAPRDVRVVRGELEPLETTPRSAAEVLPCDLGADDGAPENASEGEPSMAGDVAPLAHFFPRSVQAAVASVSV